MADVPKHGEGDLFHEVIDSFVVVSSEELQDTEKMIQKVESDFASALKFFAEDNKMQPEEFFAVFKRFTSLFETAQKDLQAERETAARAEKRNAERKARLDSLKEARANPNKPKASKALIKQEKDDEEELDKIINSAPEPTETEDNIEESVMDDMIAKVQDGKINTRAVIEESDDEEDYDEEASAAQLAETRELMKRLGMDIDSIGATAGEPTN